MLTALFPIADDNSDRLSRPFVTYALIALNIAVFVFLQLPNEAFTYAFSVVPHEILSGDDLTRAVQVRGVREVIPQAPGPNPIQLTILSAMFMHGGWAHLLGNLLYLWIFGDNVEDAMGHARFLAFYLLCGVVATAAHIVASQMAGGLGLYIPSLGASGAIAGVLGGYLILYPHKSVHVLVGFLGLISVPAILVIGAWIALQIFSGFSTVGQSGGGVAYWAHVGGAIAGLLLVKIFSNSQIKRRAQLRTEHFNDNGNGSIFGRR